jgi:hypothetical protein
MRFLGVFRKGAIFSTIYIGVLSEDFLESEIALRGETPFSRRKRGFLSRLFADGRFVMFISSQGI